MKPAPLTDEELVDVIASAKGRGIFGAADAAIAARDAQWEQMLAAQEPVAWRPKLAIPIPYVTGAPRPSDISHWETSMGCEIEYAYAAPQPAQPKAEPVNQMLLDALEELVDIVQGVLDDKPSVGSLIDSFTLQPARAAIAAAEGVKE